ncbi:hypothetical protein K469DRAFT_207804 [Zopfia rhizophila CBS 207.26]|uniref:Uncharacterized protein n=1 Tax=Zopfia rhizophila CBS 207.26 TaxID=1314779 RepID=A0A6A6DYI9_9PEZI|nr:hypothetical protein K469DRAFT_207804 [Zopfia rhizophila CBS 207.26]
MCAQFLILLLFSSVSFAEDQNATRTDNHGDTRLVCRPATNTDVIIFFLGSYVAHVATVMPLPAEPINANIPRILAVLLLPTVGMETGLRAIRNLAIFAKDDSATAARAAH